MAAALGLSAACQELEKVQMVDLSEVVLPVLNPVANIEVTPENMGNEVTFTWSAADFGTPTQISYALEVAKPAGEKIELQAGIADTEVTLGYEFLNEKLLYGLELTPEALTDVEFFISAKVGTTPKVYSAAVAAKVKVSEAERTYPMVYVIGDFNGWKDETMQKLFDFAGGDQEYSGLIGFGEKAANGFKVKGTASGWDDSCNWGLDEAAAAPDAEASLIPLISSGGSKDIKAYSKKFYNFTLIKGTPALKMNFSFNEIGVIGDATPTDWASDTKMSFDVVKQRFWVDLSLKDGGMKFRADSDWALNWGMKDGVMTQGNDNIPVTAGNYRIYLNLNDPAAPSYSLSASDYGTAGPEQPEEPEDPPAPEFKGWGIIGEAVGSWDTDVQMTNDGTWYVAKQVQLADGKEFKFRKDAGWAVNLGGLTKEDFAVNTELALKADGENFKAVGGTYDIYLNPETAKAWIINDGSYPGGGAAPVESEWGLVGTINGWGASPDIKMYVEGDYIVAKGVELKTTDEFKFRTNNAWGTERTTNSSTPISPDAEYEAVTGPQNIKISTDGTYDVYLKGTLDKFYFMTPGKTPADAGAPEVTYIDPTAASFIVGLSGSKFGWDDPSFDQNDRATFSKKTLTDATKFAGSYEFKLDNLTFAVGDEFKIRINGAWIGVGGATVEGLNTSGGDNFKAEEAGTYDLVIKFTWDGQTHSEVKATFTKK